MDIADDIFLDDVDVQNGPPSSNGAWFFSNPKMNESSTSSECNLNKIYSNDDFSSCLCLSNDGLFSSTSPSEFESSDSLNQSPFDQVPILSTGLHPQSTSPCGIEHPDASQEQIVFHNEMNQSNIMPQAYDADCAMQGSIDASMLNCNYDSGDKNSYVIVDKAVFQFLLERSQLLSEETQNKTSNTISNNPQDHSHRVSQSLSNTNSNVIYNSFQQSPLHSGYNSNNLEEVSYISKLQPQYVNQYVESGVCNGIQALYLAIIKSGNTFLPTCPHGSMNSQILDESPGPLLTTTYPQSLNYQTFNMDSYQDIPDQKTNDVNMKDSEAEDVNDLCLVCGDVASCQHYGVKSCEGCKGFFKRTIQKNASHTYICLQNTDCIIDKQNRNRCQYCRFQKCVQVGMVKEIVRKESLKGRRGRLSSKVKMKNYGSQSLYTVVNLLSTVDLAVNLTEPNCLDKLSIKDFMATDKLHRKMKQDDIISFVINEFHESMKLVKLFSDKLIGFSTLAKRDQNLIMLLNGLEFLTLRSAIRHRNSPVDKSKTLKSSLDGCIILDNGCILTKNLLSRSIFNEWSKKTVQLSSELQVLQKCDQEIINGLLVVTLLKIEIDSDESKLLEDASLVYSLRHRYVEVLKTYCGSKSNPETLGGSSKKHSLNVNLKSPDVTQITTQLPDSKLLSRLLDKQTMVQSIVEESLLKPLIKHYFGTDNINDCDKVVSSLLLGQEILSFCPKWLFKLVMYKTLPHLCKHQFA